ncbi:hypothetical protein ACA910_018437 [Epithemia clementina (nom. ined.)]
MERSNNNSHGTGFRLDVPINAPPGAGGLLAQQQQQHRAGGACGSGLLINNLLCSLQQLFSHLSIHPFPGTSVLGLGGNGSGAGFSTLSSAVLPLSSLEAATAGHALVEHKVLGANGRPVL